MDPLSRVSSLWVLCAKISVEASHPFPRLRAAPAGTLVPSPCVPGDCNRTCCPYKGYDFWCNPNTKTCARCALCPPGYFSVGCVNGKPRCLKCCAADSPVICRLCKGRKPANGLPGSVWTWNPVTRSCVEKPLLG